ncbi:MAG: patatin-like phospholipase family protein [Actinobacteria bacterium]|nr:patatin-like phospholipase family protein [Actinomycetota bacterium]
MASKVRAQPTSQGREDDAGRGRGQRRKRYDDHADLVLEGGGVKGIAHVGALVGLEEHGVTTFPRVAGTSAGSIVGALAAAGMPSSALREVMRRLDYRRFRDRSGIARIPVVGKAASLVSQDGIYDGEYLREFLGNELHALGVETFADLRVDDARYQGELPDRNYKLVVMATDVTHGRLVRLPWDYRALYGLDPDRQLVVDAVRASISIPFFFKPVTLRDADGTPSTLVDGGVLSNFAIDVFDRRDGQPPRWPTFGVKLLPEMPAGRIHLFPLLGLVPRGPVNLFELLVSTMLVGHDQTQLSQPWVDVRTIRVDTNAVGVLDFHLGEDAANGLYRSGRMAAGKFLSGWNFAEYKRDFRSDADAGPARTRA